MATPSILTVRWKEAFGAEERPTLYSSTEPQKKNFASLNSSKNFIKDLESLSHPQLYALAENCQLALNTAQDEYLHIECLVRHLEQKDPPLKPNFLLEPDRYEEEKEAALYGYKRFPRGMPYTRTKDGAEFYGFQEPFSQGGFVPTEAQYKRMKANAKDPNNIDGWTPIVRDGKKLIPRMPRSPPPRQKGFTGALTRPSRKRRLVEQGLSDTDATAAFSDSDAFDTPSKHLTRVLGRKIPPTRDASETPGSNRHSPAPSRQHRFIMNNLTQALLSSSASTRPSVNSTPPPHETSPTPSHKRRRITHQNNEHRFTTAISSRSSPVPHDPEEKKWTDVSLISAINADHSFLHPDPAIALNWKHAILNAPNPVRSYAMKRKWAWWRKGGMDKRPRRGWREGTGEGDESQENEIRDGPRTKMEDAKAAGFVKQEEENDFRSQHYEEAPGLQGRPAPPLRWKQDDPFNEPYDTKQPPTMQPQRDRQFTFKIDHPPPPPSLLWRTDEQRRAEPTIHKIEKLSSPPPFLQRDPSLPTNRIPLPPPPPPPLQHYGHAPPN
ncbi:hypothetical protein EPUS_06243 [Endocarpon pusillum Z07020]|uniref:Uncharacterized protein n=1 Tax=Endocarpon pusillum (strain Z07020 / HMAS-L-300199) TaxID=1263415 RepID=U1HIS4_ENDPU|nr:uncharacterized protein EPUS_06243 [Endocarpon pusillum Z07020]ERF68799.1 hypothetical protein EPUS_06243 [Endocarpon pusillum Z07020]